MALGAMQAIHEAGMRVPDDVAVMGFDGLDQGALWRPPLSTVAQPVTALGREAARALLALIEQPAVPPAAHVLPTHLTLRRSCGCAMPSGDGNGVEREPLSVTSAPAGGEGGSTG